MNAIPTGLKPKTINWKQIKPAEVSNTIFKDLKEADFEPIKVDFDLLTNVFCSQENEPKKIEAPKGPVVELAKSVLDGKRHQAAIFAFKKYRFDTEEIIETLFNMGDLHFDGEKLRTIKRLVPEGEEIAALKAEKDNADKLDEVNFFMLNLMKIPKLDKHLRCTEIKTVDFE